jgi:uncharacterized repeat protein (TIGR01451 family)
MPSRRTRGLALVAAIASLVAASFVLSGTGAARPDPAPTLTPQRGILHWYGRGRAGVLGMPGGPRNMSTDSINAVGDLTFHNGPIMPSTSAYLIFWLPAGNHFSGRTGGLTDADYENAMSQYFTDVSGSQIYNTTTQYTGSNGTPTTASSVAGTFVDTTAFPHPGTHADPVTGSDVFNEINNVRVAKGWPLGTLTDMYFIFMPAGIVTCSQKPTVAVPNPDCNTNAYCAYHSHVFFGTDDVAHSFLYSEIDDNRDPATANGGCGDSNVTGDESADTTLSSLEHEHLEAVTDPRGDGWFFNNGAGENGDQCNRFMGVADSTTPDAYMNGHKYRIQREWSNAAHDSGGSAPDPDRGCAASYRTTGSKVVSPAPGLSDVTKTVTEGTIAGNPGDTLHYHVSFHNPSDQDDAINVTLTDTLPIGVQSGGSGTVTHNFPDLAPHQTATFDFTAHPTGALMAGTTLTNSASFAFQDSTGTAQTPIVRTASTNVVNAPPTLTVPGPQTQDYHDALSFNVSATDSDDSLSSLTFSATGLPNGLTLTNNGDGTATVSGTINDVPGPYSASICVDDHHHASPVCKSVSITVTREETTTTYISPTVVAQNNPVTLHGQLLEDGTTGPNPFGQTLQLSVGSQSCTGLTDSAGNASCTIPNVTVPQGPVTFKAEFFGDTFYLPSSGTASGFVFAFPSRGDFVLGDTTVAGAGPSTSLTFWGAQWSALNVLTGGAAPTAFKGFAGTPSTTPPSCGGTWTTAPGNSSNPVSSIPSYMGVIVSSHVTQSGSTISGDIAKIVVVKTDPGYSTNPGHPGTGTLVATYC